ncbi:Lipopolysaccharide heptosyltransferase 1 [Anatilimnocola aggregata]|uniref:Lipopolysaccharide heptosyltransferase 1 n=1 Tax=Anatilimnocola aggregata TaxID=2528021 RepID=A0A517YKV8_9BACT|nr:glycosyltransferase family 9 protein [Anatilimnocola aggregata]QDU30840.1 Lipopolysaccharide heptosyltransferase 1 [Anatilimnocola aggregata]
MTSQLQTRFLITRLSAIGDCVLTMPMACALRDAFPQAWIGWLAEAPGASLLQGHAALDEVIVAPRRVLQDPVELWKLRGKLRTYKIDITLDPQGLTKSSVLGWLTGAKQRIGFHSPVGREISRWFNNCKITSRQSHVVDRYRELLSVLDIQPGKVRFDVPRQPGATQVMAQWLKEQNLTTQAFAIINAGAGWDSKVWLPERYAAVSRHLLAKHGLPTVVVWAGDREEGWAKEVVAGSQQAARMAPNTTLPELAALSRHARLFVGSDTGPLHLAAAVGVPCAGVYGPTNPAECGPYGSVHRSVQTFLQKGSVKERRKAENVAMQAVTVEQVSAACDQVMENSRASRAAA